MPIKTMFTFDQINDATGFANGEIFTCKSAVREYFTEQNMQEMGFGVEPDEAPVSQERLSVWADSVAFNQWHCEFATLN